MINHLVAFVAFNLMLRKHRNLDFFNVMRLQEEDLIIPYEKFANNVEIIRNAIFDLKERGLIDHATHLKGDLHQVIDHGIRNVGMYHSKRPVVRNSQGDITTKDITVLYYYHNRLKGYELSKRLQ
jgi:glycerol-3-phosphate O-acyltransferase